MEYRNLTIIGSSHIAIESVNKVREAIETLKPEIVALELDPRRAQVLLKKGEKETKDYLYILRKVGIKGFIFSLIGEWAEKKLGKIVNIKPGTEMLVALKLARKNNISVALIDQDIEVTLRRFSQALTWKEKFRFIADFVRALFSRKKIDFDLRKVPSQELIKKLVKEVKARYPNIYKVLVEERNHFMARNLYNLMKTNKKIIAVMGAGHEEDIIRIIKILEKKNIIYL